MTVGVFIKVPSFGAAAITYTVREPFLIGDFGSSMVQFCPPYE
jgi:hypothetical protein